MAVRRLFRTWVLDWGVFWEEIANKDGWKIQFNPTLEATAFLKPYRLISPDKRLFASADSPKELVEELPKLAKEALDLGWLVRPIGEVVVKGLAEAVLRYLGM